MHLGSNAKDIRKLLVKIYKIIHSTKSPPLLLLTFFSIFGLQGLLCTNINPSLMFKNCAIPGCVMNHGIILQYAHSCMDIHSKNSPKLEEYIDMILCVSLTHIASSTLQQELTMRSVVMSSFSQVLHQQSPLHPLVIYCTLLIKIFNGLIPTIIQELNFTMIKCNSCSK